MQLVKKKLVANTKKVICELCQLRFGPKYPNFGLKIGEAKLISGIEQNFEVGFPFGSLISNIALEF